MGTGTLSEVVTVKGRFHRSVQLVRDWQEQRGLEEYLFTPTAHDLTSQILGGARTPEGPRAWSITGPYGTGKSAFALFLTDLLANKLPKNAEARKLRLESGLEKKTFLPVLVSGQRASLATELLLALAQSLKQISSSQARRMSRVANSRNIHNEKVVALFEDAARLARNDGHTGLLLIIDEFGKFLEYAAQNPESEDLLVLQYLAEAASRSNPQILFLTILHTAYTEYLHGVDQTQRHEWQKVQGRFADVAFLEPPEQFLRLIGVAIERHMSDEAEAVYARYVDDTVASEALSEARRRLPLDKLLLACMPLDPFAALLLWPLFRSKVAQNERSLFAFLTSREPFGFQEFLSLTKQNEGCAELYRTDHLYDYVKATLSGAIFLGDKARHWSEIEQALDRIESASPRLAQAVIKTVGLLGMYGIPVGLRASKETVGLALGNKKEAADALAYLERASIVVYRQHEDAYGLWEGSDVNLEQCYSEAQRHVGAGEIADRLKSVINLRPIVARAHYILTGTLRYFLVCVIDGSESRLCEALEEDLKQADGQVIYVLTRNLIERRELINLAKKLTQEGSAERKLRVLAFPKPIAGLETALAELEAWIWVSENVPALQGDPVAKREVRARIEHAGERLKAIAGAVLGLRGSPFDPAASEWVQGGSLHDLSSAPQFLQWLSKLCDTVYCHAPVLHNELLNREYLSSAAAAARRNLVAAMLANEEEPRLGFERNPAEVSMYRALLEAGGFHRKSRNAQRFMKPKARWQPIWNAMEEFLRKSKSGRRPIQELASILKNPPYGVREGPIPVLLCALLLVHRDDVALYENGLFVPELRIEAFERLMRAPEIFEIQNYELSAAGRKAFVAAGKVIEALKLSEDKTTKPRLLQVIKPLVIFAARLPAYTKRTKRLEPAEAVPVRDALLRARDPHRLMFVELPEALGTPLNQGSTKRFANGLKTCLQSLQGAYPRLLDEIEKQIRTAFDLRGTSVEARRQLQSRALPLDGYSVDRTLSLFVRESRHIDGRDWREVLGTAVNQGVPPSQWHDADVVDFQIRLQQLRNDFMRLEEVLAEQKRTGANRIFRISLLDGNLQEMREVISVTPERISAIESLVERIAAVLDDRQDKSEESRRINLAALSEIAARFFRREGEQK